jgi:4-amino-4-deoxy-L-arabinose transferase-like glycosyltransferase
MAAAGVKIRARRASQAGLPAPVAVRSWPGGGWLWLAAPLVAILLATAVLPPTDFDVCEYHLQAPKEFFQAGRIGFLPHNVYANMPLGTEMLSLLAMSLTDDWWRGALIGKLLTASFALFAAIGLLAAGRRLFSTGAGVIAALVYLTTPWIFFTSAAGLIDAVLAFYLLAAVHALLLWKPSSGFGLPTLSGYLAGAAVATKYPGMLFVVLPLAAAVAVIGWCRSVTLGPRWPARLRIAVRPLAVFLLAVLLGCGLWLAKNWALTGNPTYPLLYSVFGGKTWNAEKDARWNRVHRPHDFSAQAITADLKRLAWQSPWQSPVLVPLAFLNVLGLAMGVAGRIGRRNVAILAGLLLYFLAAWWLLTHRIDRFWIPALPLAALLAGQGACWSTERLWRWPLAVIFVLAVAYSLLMALSGAMGDNRYFYRLAELRENPGRSDPWRQFFNQQAAKGRVLLIGEARVFDFEVPILYATCFDDLPLASLAAGQGPAQVHAELLERGISYAYVNWAEIERYRRPGNYGFSPLPQPALFHQLVTAGVLEPLPPIPGNAGRAYRVRP